MMTLALRSITKSQCFHSSLLLCSGLVRNHSILFHLLTPVPHSTPKYLHNPCLNATQPPNMAIASSLSFPLSFFLPILDILSVRISFWEKFCTLSSDSNLLTYYTYKNVMLWHMLVNVRHLRHTCLLKCSYFITYQEYLFYFVN